MLRSLIYLNPTTGLDTTVSWWESETQYIYRNPGGMVFTDFGPERSYTFRPVVYRPMED